MAFQVRGRRARQIDQGRLRLKRGASVVAARQARDGGNPSPTKKHSPQKQAERFLALARRDKVDGGVGLDNLAGQPSRFRPTQKHARLRQ